MSGRRRRARVVVKAIGRAGLLIRTSDFGLRVSVGSVLRWERGIRCRGEVGEVVVVR
jgi:hypothetical protein